MSDFFKQVQLTLGRLYFFRYALWQMALTQLKSRYAGSFLGIFWAVISPILIMLVLTFVFTWVFKSDVKDYPFFVLAGIIPWLFLSNALSEATGAMVNQGNLLKQFRLSSMALPLSGVLANFLNFLISWALIYPFFVMRDVQVLALLPLLVLLFVLQFLFVCGIGISLSVLNVFFRDTAHLLGVILMLWFWMTPVFYRLDMIPKEWAWIFKINPVVANIVCYQQVIFEGVVPSWGLMVEMLGWTVGALVLGMVMFVKCEPLLLKKI